MTNAIIAYGNRTDEATTSGGGWSATLPLTNIQDRRIGKVARSTSAALVNTTFDLAFSGTRLFRVLALVGHNFSLAAKYRIRLSIAPTFATTVADSGWVDVWPVIYPSGALPWGSPSWWTGRASADDAAAYTAVVPYVLSQSYNAQYIRVEIDDTANTAGYVQVGRVFCSDGWQPVRNMAYGASLAWESRTEVQEALSGAEYFNARAAPRVARFEFPAMAESDAMANAFEIQRSVGTSGEVFFVWDPADTTHAIRRQFLGRIRTLSPIENPGPNRWRAPFEIKELL